MFGTSAFDRMPDAFLTDPAVWDAFMGDVWMHMLAPLALPPDACIIEIAPGSSAKIGHALAALSFSGVLHVIEASAPALDILAARYRQLLPAATLHLHAAPLTDCLQALPAGADALVGNHILDDMLLNASTTDSDTFDWATRYSNTLAPQTRAAFDALAQQQERAIAAVSAEVSDAIAQLAPQHIVLSQYPSSTLAEHGLDALNTCASATLARIHDVLRATYAFHDCAPALGKLPHYHNAHIGFNVLNPGHWLSCTRRI